jgi:hypothetical protein
MVVYGVSSSAFSGAAASTGSSAGLAREFADLCRDFWLKIVREAREGCFLDKSFFVAACTLTVGFVPSLRKADESCEGVVIDLSSFLRFLLFSFSSAFDG